MLKREHFRRSRKSSFYCMRPYVLCTIEEMTNVVFYIKTSRKLRRNPALEIGRSCGHWDNIDKEVAVLQFLLYLWHYQRVGEDLKTRRQDNILLEFCVLSSFKQVTNY